MTRPQVRVVQARFPVNPADDLSPPTLIRAVIEEEPDFYVVVHRNRHDEWTCLPDRGRCVKQPCGHVLLVQGITGWRKT